MALHYYDFATDVYIYKYIFAFIDGSKSVN